MARANYNIELVQGDDSDTTVIYETDGNPVDLTGYDAKMQIRTCAKSSQVIAELTSTPAAGLTITPLTGTIFIEISKDDTKKMANDEYEWDLEIINTAGDGKVETIIGGKVLVTREVTR